MHSEPSKPSFTAGAVSYVHSEIQHFPLMSLCIWRRGDAQHVESHDTVGWSRWSDDHFHLCISNGSCVLM